MYIYKKNPTFLYLLTRSPSAHLIKLLRQHEALQRRCGPGTEAYRAAATRLRSWCRNDTKDGVCSTSGDAARPPTAASPHTRARVGGYGHALQSH